MAGDDDSGHARFSTKVTCMKKKREERIQKDLLLLLLLECIVSSLIDHQSIYWTTYILVVIIGSWNRLKVSKDVKTACRLQDVYSDDEMTRMP